MTRKEYVGIFKVYGLALLCIIPILIGLNMLLNGVVSNVVMTVIDCIVILVGTVIAIKINDKHKEKIQQKRAEFEARQKQNAKGEKN